MEKDMKLGLIGNPLGHSWSPAIHSYLIHADYSLMPLEEEELKPFLEKRDFDGINVTIPYKQTVIPCLDELDENAEKIGAVNCIVNENGRLKGYNTDYEGFRDMLIGHDVPVEGNNVAVLGSGGASKAVRQAIISLKGNPVIISRHKKDGVLTYDELYEQENNFQIIVNTTPVGMSPHMDEVPLDLSRFTSLHYVVDIIANPLCTKLCFEAKRLGIPHLGGFEMLVRQALAADRYFLRKDVDEKLVVPCMNALLEERRNIVLTGMPTSGKTTIAEKLQELTGKKTIEMDDEIVQRIGMSISDYFAEYGEESFRRIEREVAEEHMEGKGEIISCGGGVIKTPETMRALCSNGTVIWIDRDLNYLYSTSDRPLASDQKQVLNLYQQRLPLYDMYSDIHVKNNSSLEDCIDKIIKETGIKEKRK